MSITTSGSVITFPNSTTQASGAKILQVVTATTGTAFINNSGSTGNPNWLSSPITASITPLFSTSKILIMVQANVGGNTSYNQLLAIVRGASTYINIGTSGTNNSGPGISTSCRQSDNDGLQPCVMTYLDSPATTSSTSYTVYLGNSAGGAGQARINETVNNSSYTGNPLSTITLLEVGA